MWTHNCTNPILLIEIDWPFGNVTKELLTGIEVMTSSIKQQTWCIALACKTHDEEGKRCWDIVDERVRVSVALFQLE